MVYYRLPMKKNHFIILYIIIIGLITVIISTRDQWLSGKSVPLEEPKQVSNFNECVAKGFPVQESYPRRCIANQNQIFTEEITPPLEPTEQDNLNITVFSPKKNESISSPVTIKGQARGNWYFEASFPVAIYDSNNLLLAEAPATAEGEWMTENFVPFSLTLSFPKPSTATGKIILKKDNPSGLPEYDDQIEVPIIFSSEASE